jgi:adenylate cyclase
MADTPSRKLAVFLHADVVGSTMLVQRDESLAHERIQDAFQRLSSTTSTYGGTAHEIRGDALVAEFSRASDAVCAALVFQADNIDRPEVRIGISLGEVVVADGTVTGAGVVLAQRLEQLAEPGGVVVQGSVSETVPTRLPFEFESLGEQTLKGFDQPVRALRVGLKAGEVVPEPEAVPVGFEPTERPTIELPGKPSIAVLPFANMSDDPEQEYFSDGITEDIITALSRISGLLVVARNSTMVYKGKAVDVKQVGREQGVRYVLEGSVRRSANRIRVSAQLIDATTGHHQWADHYDRDLGDVFAVQDDITHKIVVEMRVQVSVGEKARMLAGRTQSVAAWEQLIRADELSGRHIKEANVQARRSVEEALQIDPCYASAWTELGWTHMLDAYFGWTDSREHSLEKALEAADRALELEEDYPNALALLGLAHERKGEHDRAVELTERAVALAPNNAENNALFARVLAFAGKPDEAVEIFNRATRLSPIYPAWYLVGLGICHYLMNELDLAIDTFQEAIAREPDSALARIYLTSAFVEAGLMEDAKLIAREVMSIERNFSAKNLQKGVAQFKDAKIGEKMIENVLRAGLPE